MELKVLCNCGQKYKFDVDPVNGRMPFAVNCPVCGVDGTPLANQLLAQGPLPPSVPSVLRINNPPPPPPMASAPPPPPMIAAATTVAAPMRTAAAVRTKAPGEFNMGLGVLGAFLGAGIGAGLMYAFFAWANFRFPLMGTGVGALSGLGARLFFKGTESTLGAITATIALCATGGTLYFMYGGFSVMFLITMAVSASMAWKIAG